MANAATATRDRNFAYLIGRAHAAGMQAGRSVKPTPMHLTDGTNHWTIEEGPCGFAWINTPGNTSFARWIRKNRDSVENRIGCGVHKGYPKGLELYVRHFGQSVERKAAYAKAFAAVLSEAGVKCYAADRLD